MTTATRVLNVVIGGGGTGGHVFPGVATAEAIRALAPGARITFVGTGRPVERRALERYPYDYAVVSSPRLERGWHAGNVLLPLRFAAAIVKARSLLRRGGAHLVVGTGGYGSAPVVMAAWLAGIPRLLLEQNIIPGLTNRVLARFADVVCLTFAPAADYFNRRTRVVITGNPIRPVAEVEAAAAARQRLGLDPARFTVFVGGGSQGARRIVEAVRGAWDLWEEDEVQLIVQTGADTALELPPGQRVRAVVRAFFDDIYECYRAADVVVGRAGGGVAEALAFGKPLILIPYPYAAHDHQSRNAIYLEQEGAAVVVEDQSFTAPALVAAVRGLIREPERRQRMARASRELGRPGAAHDVARAALTLVGYPA